MGYISDIDVTTPDGNVDYVNELDDFIKSFKTDVKSSFPNISGAVNASHTELNAAYQVTLGTASAQKFLSVDANRDVSNINELIAATLSDGTITITGGVLSGGNIGADVNLLDGVDAVTQTVGNSSTKVATTEFVDAEIADQVPTLVPGMTVLQLGRVIDNTTRSLGSSDTIVSTEFEITPNSASSVLLVVFTFSVTVDFSGSSGRCYIKPTYRDSSDILTNYDGYSEFGMGAFGGGVGSGSIDGMGTFVFYLTQSHLNSSGNWKFSITGYDVGTATTKEKAAIYAEIDSVS